MNDRQDNTQVDNGVCDIIEMLTGLQSCRKTRHKRLDGGDGKIYNKMRNNYSAIFQ